MIKTINVPKGTELAIIGDIHEHDSQFFELIDKIKPSKDRWIVSVGDAIDKGFGLDSFNKVTNKLIDLENQGFGFAVMGNHEIKAIKKNKKNLSQELAWWKKRPLSILFKFWNGSSVLVVHAGVSPNHSLEGLGKDYSVLYMREVDEEGNMISLVWKEIDGKKFLVKPKGGTLWHELYDGRFGYIVSGHISQKDGKPKFYGYSANIDSAVYETGILTSQIINSKGGRGDLIQAEGEAAKPELNINY